MAVWCGPLAPAANAPAAYTLVGVRGELADLKKSVAGGSTAECENCATIRLVTLVEQFFRIMIKDDRLKGYKIRNSKMSQISSSVMGDIFRHHAKKRESADYDETICRFYSAAANVGSCKFFEDSRVVQFPNVQEIDRLVNGILGAPNNDISEWIYVHTQTFQHVYRVQHYAGDMFRNKNTRSMYTKFFDTRHVLVHTLNLRPPDTSGYFGMVEDLFDRVERENP